MTKRQKLIAYWLACNGADTILNARRIGLPPARSDWDGFVDYDDGPEPTLGEIQEVIVLLSKDYYKSL